MDDFSSYKKERNIMSKSKPTPPSPQNPTARFKFFTGPQGKDFGPAVIQREMQRYAFTPQGNKFFRELQKKQHEQMALHKSTGLVDAPKKDQSNMVILPQKKSLFGGLKNIFKSQRGS